MSSERFVSASIWRFVSSRRRGALDLGLLLDALDLRVRDLARVGEDLRRLALRVGDQLAVLLEELARLLARLVGLVDGCADAVAPLVDGLLDRAEREPPEHEERDREADQRPDHEPGDDVDQAPGRLLFGCLGEERTASTQTRTYASRPPMRP